MGTLGGRFGDPKGHQKGTKKSLKINKISRHPLARSTWWLNFSISYHSRRSGVDFGASEDHFLSISVPPGLIFQLISVPRPLNPQRKAEGTPCHQDEKSNVKTLFDFWQSHLPLFLGSQQKKCPWSRRRSRRSRRNVEVV